MKSEKSNVTLPITFIILFLLGTVVGLTIKCHKANKTIAQQQIVIDSLNTDLGNYILLYNLAEEP